VYVYVYVIHSTPLQLGQAILVLLLSLYVCM